MFLGNEAHDAQRKFGTDRQRHGGVRTLEELLKLAPDAYNITVFGEEPYGNYNRIMLSPVLASEKTIEQIMLNSEQWYVDNGITLHKGKKVEQINRARREVIAADGTVAKYDRLIIATGFAALHAAAARCRQSGV